MNKLLLAAIFISAPIFSMTGSGYTIVSEKITSTPGFNIRVIHDDNPVDNNDNALGYASASLNKNQRGTVKQHNQISSGHQVGGTNKTGEVQLFTYKYTLTCGESYGEYVRVVKLQYPGSNFNTGDRVIADVYTEEPGELEITATTTLSGPANASHTAKSNLIVK